MLLNEPTTTRFDLHFRIFGTPVRVHPMFWLLSAILGWGWSHVPVLPGNGLGDVALWVLCVFLSVLLHELGHVWMGRIFGRDGHIVLHSMGGLAIGSGDVPHRWQRILVSAAGPAIQLLLFAVLLGLTIALLIPWPTLQGEGGLANALASLKGNPALTRMLSMLLLINLFWPLLNLLPIWPLDGGQITREACQIVSPQRGLVVSLWISLLVSGLFAVNALVLYLSKGQTEVLPFIGRLAGGMWMGILFGLFAVGSWQALQQVNAQRRRFWDDEVPWER